MPTSTEFPNNVMDVVLDHTDTALPEVMATLRRPLRTSDPNLSVGMFPVDWTPRPDSMQIGSPVPILQAYNFRMHLMVKHTNEEEGRAAYANASKKLRVMLYHDQTLAVALQQLKEEAPDHFERLMRYGVRTQRFLNNEVQGQFIFLSATEFWVETEIHHIGG